MCNFDVKLKFSSNIDRFILRWTVFTDCWLVSCMILLIWAILFNGIHLNLSSFQLEYYLSSLTDSFLKYFLFSYLQNIVSLFCLWWLSGGLVGCCFLSFSVWLWLWSRLLKARPSPTAATLTLLTQPWCESLVFSDNSVNNSLINVDLAVFCLATTSSRPSNSTPHNNAAYYNVVLIEQIQTKFFMYSSR